MSKNPTVAQIVTAALAAAPHMDEAAVRVVIKEQNIRSIGKATNVFSAMKPASSRKGRIRSTRIIEAGPRGFRFNSDSNPWNESIKAAAGIAVHPAYQLKLKAHAEFVGVKYTTDAVATAKAIAATMQ